MSNKCLVEKCKKSQIDESLCPKHQKIADEFTEYFEAALRTKSAVPPYIVDNTPLEIIKYVLEGHSGPTKEEIMSWASGRIKIQKEEVESFSSMSPGYKYMAIILLDGILKKLETTDIK